MVEADFSGMTGLRDLCIGQVIHKAVIEVTEEGTEAAAATSVGMAPTSASLQLEDEKFVVDHPFLFYIVDENTGTILFAGRVVDL